MARISTYPAIPAVDGASDKLLIYDASGATDADQTRTITVDALAAAVSADLVSEVRVNQSGGAAYGALSHDGSRLLITASAGSTVDLVPPGIGNLNLGSSINAVQHWGEAFFRVAAIMLPNKTLGFMSGEFAVDVALARADANAVKVTNGSTGGGVLELPQVASGGTPTTDSARVYSKLNAGTAEVYVKDEAGNETQVSPHAADGPAGYADAEVVLKHRNDYTGVTEWLYLTRALRDLEGLTGNQYLFAREPAEGEAVKDWDDEQDRLQDAYDRARDEEERAREAWETAPPDKRAKDPPPVRPEKDVRKQKPDWL